MLIWPSHVKSIVLIDIKTIGNCLILLNLPCASLIPRKLNCRSKRNKNDEKFEFPKKLLVFKNAKFEIKGLRYSWGYLHCKLFFNCVCQLSNCSTFVNTFKYVELPHAITVLHCLLKVIALVSSKVK